MDDAPASAQNEDTAAGAGNGPTPADNTAAPAAVAAAPKKKKIRKTDVPFQASSICGYSKAQLDDFFEKEHQMQAADRLQEETNERKNALEG